MMVAHLAFQLGTRYQGGNRINHQHINRPGTHQRIGNFQCLFTGIRLGNQKLIQINAQFTCIGRVEGVFGIHKGTISALCLRFGYGMERQRCFARRFRPVNFDNPPFWKAANTKSDIQPERAGGNRLDIDHTIALTQLHDRAFAKGFFYLANRRIQCLAFIIFVHFKIHEFC